MSLSVPRTAVILFALGGVWWLSRGGGGGGDGPGEGGGASGPTAGAPAAEATAAMRSRLELAVTSARNAAENAVECRSSEGADDSAGAGGAAGTGSAIGQAGGPRTPEDAARRLVALMASASAPAPGEAPPPGTTVEFVEDRPGSPWQVAVRVEPGGGALLIEGFGPDLSEPLLRRRVPCR